MSRSDAKNSDTDCPVAPADEKRKKPELACDIMSVFGSLLCGTENSDAGDSKKENSPTESRSPIEGSTPEALSTTDSTHLGAFQRVMTQGIVMRLYTSEGPKEIKVSLVGEDLRWHDISQRIMRGSKQYKIFLGDIVAVAWGKNTTNFSLEGISTICQLILLILYLWYIYILYLCSFAYYCVGFNVIHSHIIALKTYVCLSRRLFLHTYIRYYRK